MYPRCLINKPERELDLRVPEPDGRMDHLAHGKLTAGQGEIKRLCFSDEAGGLGQPRGVLISELPEQVLRRVAGRGGMDESSGWAGGLSLGRLDGKPAHDAPKVECM